MVLLLTQAKLHDIRQSRTDAISNTTTITVKDFTINLFCLKMQKVNLFSITKWPDFCIGQH